MNKRRPAKPGPEQTPEPQPAVDPCDALLAALALILTSNTAHKCHAVARAALDHHEQT